MLPAAICIILIAQIRKHRRKTIGDAIYVRPIVQIAVPTSTTVVINIRPVSRRLERVAPLNDRFLSKNWILTGKIIELL